MTSVTTEDIVYCLLSGHIIFMLIHTHVCGLTFKGQNFGPSRHQHLCKSPFQKSYLRNEFDFQVSCIVSES